MMRNKNENGREQMKQAKYFIVAVFALSLPIYIVFLASGRPVQESGGLIFLLMWTPAAAAAALRIAGGNLFRRRSSDSVPMRRRGVNSLKLGFPRGHRGAIAAACGLAILFPIAAGMISYGAAWKIGMAEFTGEGGLQFLLSILRAAVLGSLFSIPQVLGEEIGWRGCMSEKLEEAGIRAPFVLGGLMWALWHTPLILSGQYASGPYPVVSVLSFAVLMIALHSIWSLWTLRTGSLWPAVIGHGAWNTLIQFTFDGHTSGTGAALWVGDSGIITVCAAAALSLLIFSKKERSNRLLDRIYDFRINRG